jgi:hypothetical protein
MLTVIWAQVMTIPTSTPGGRIDQDVAYVVAPFASENATGAGSTPPGVTDQHTCTILSTVALTAGESRGYRSAARD